MNDLYLFFDSLHLLEESSSDWQTINQNCLIIWYDDEFRRTFRHEYFLYLQNANSAFDFVISHNVEIHVWKKDFPVFSLAFFYLHKALCLAFQLLVQTRCDFVKLGLHQNYTIIKLATDKLGQCCPSRTMIDLSAWSSTHLWPKPTQSLEDIQPLQFHPNNRLRSNRSPLHFLNCKSGSHWSFGKHTQRSIRKFPWIQLPRNLRSFMQHWWC